MIIRNCNRLLKKIRTVNYNNSNEFHSSSVGFNKKIIGIRREDTGIWERRAPLAPNHVRKLVMKDEYKVIVQPSNRRAFQTPVSVTQLLFTLVTSIQKNWTQSG